MDEWIRKKSKPLTVRPSPWSKGAAKQPPAIQSLPQPSPYAPVPSPSQPPYTSFQAQKPTSGDSVQAPQQPITIPEPQGPPQAGSPMVASSGTTAPLRSAATQSGDPLLSADRQAEAGDLPKERLQQPASTEIPANSNSNNDSGEFRVRDNTDGSHHMISIDRDGNMDQQ
jgi:hypothetical protein